MCDRCLARWVQGRFSDMKWHVRDMVRKWQRGGWHAMPSVKCCSCAASTEVRPARCSRPANSCIDDIGVGTRAGLRANERSTPSYFIK